MYVSHGAVSIHCRPGILEPNESFQAVVSSPSNEVVVVVSQLQVHFWVCLPHGGLVYLSSLRVPRASPDEDPAVHALWHPHRGNRLAVITSRRVVFMEADLHPPRQDFLGLNDRRTLLAKGSVCGSAAAFCDVRSRVCFSEEVDIENGIVSSVSPAGPHAFLVNTTAGVVYVVGWGSAQVLHTFTVASLRAPNHAFTIVGRDAQEQPLATPAPSSHTDTTTMTREGANGDGASQQHQQQQQLQTHHRILTGAILHATFNPKLQLFSMVLSSGYLLLAQASCGIDFRNQEVNLSGCFVPAAAACSSSINGTHALLAVATHSGNLSCYRIQESRGGGGGQSAQAPAHFFITPTSPLWRRYGTHKGDGTSSVRGDGPISAMEWSPGREDALCVGYFRVGVMVLHYSGTCLLSSFGTDSPSAASPLVLLPQQRAASAAAASASAPFTRSALSGCLSVHWCHNTRRVLAVEPQSRQLVSFRMARVISAREVGPSTGVHTPLCVMDDDGIFVTDYSAATGAEGHRSFVAAPPNRLAGALPLRYGSVSRNGNCVAVAGRKGLLVYSRHTGEWSGFPTPQEEGKCVCLCDPAWLGDSMVAVAVVQDTTKYFAAVFLATDMSWAAAVAKLPLDARPTRLSVTNRDARGDGFLVVQDVLSRLHIFRFNVFCDKHRYANRPVAPSEKVRVVFTPLRCVELDVDGVVLLRPLDVWPVCTSATGIREGYTGAAPDDVPCLVIQPEKEHSLVLLHPIGDDPFTARAKQFQTIKLGSRVGYTVTRITPPGAMAFDFWVDRFSPLDGVSLAVHEEAGFFYYHIAHPTAAAQAANGTEADSSTTRLGPQGQRQGEWTGQRIDRMCLASRESEIVPVCLSPYDGFALGISEGHEAASRSPDAAAARFNTFGDPFSTWRPILYAPRVLGLVLQKSMPAILKQQQQQQQQQWQQPPAAQPSSKTVPTAVAATPATTTTTTTPREESVRPATSAVVTGPGSVVSAHSKPASASRERVTGVNDASALPGGGRLTATFTWDERLFHWLQSMRENGSFVVSLDCFLMSILDDSPPGGIAQLDRKGAVRAVVGLLRCYPEFFEVMVGCVRKIDMSHWHVVFDFLGSPLDLYRECIDNGQLNEAVHLVRVIMMTGYGIEQEALRESQQQVESTSTDSRLVRPARPSASRRETLQQACACAITLFDHTIRNGDFSAAYDLLRFTALVRHEMGMPAAVDAGAAAAADAASANGSGAGGLALGRWLRTLVGGGGGGGDQAGSASADGCAGSAVPVKGCSLLYFARRQTAPRAAAVSEAGVAGAAMPPTASPGSSDANSIGGTQDVDEAEGQQRLSAIQLMFSTYPELPAMMEEEASRLFLQGHFLRLCRLLETFSLSLDDFVHAQLRECGGDFTDADGAVSGSAARKTRCLHLSSIFDGIHQELGLPRSGRPLGLVGSQALCEPGSAIQEQMSMWSQAQVTLYGNRRIMDTLYALQTLFGNRHVYLDLAFAIVRMSVAGVIAIVTTDSAASDAQSGGAPEAEWTPARIARSVALLAEVSSLVSLPANQGYSAFVGSVVDSLPPTMLKADGYVRSAAAAAADRTAPSPSLPQEQQATSQERGGDAEPEAQPQGPEQTLCQTPATDGEEETRPATPSRTAV